MAHPEANTMTVTVTNVTQSHRHPIFVRRHRAKLAPLRRATILALALALVLSLFAWGVVRRGGEG